MTFLNKVNTEHNQSGILLFQLPIFLLKHSWYTVLYCFQMSNIFIWQLYTIAKIQRQPKYPTIDERVKMRRMCTVGRHSARAVFWMADGIWVYHLYEQSLMEPVFHVYYALADLDTLNGCGWGLPG